jgi:uncharacterized protein YndB with AHSA1/START domain
MASVNETQPIRGSVQRRIAAPMDAVWSELVLPETLMATMPLEGVQIAADARSGSFTARIGLGPFRFSRTGTGAITEAKEPERIVFEMTLDDRSLTSLHTAELTAGGDDETVLNYTVELRQSHPMPRLRRFLAGVFDLHVRDYADRVSATSARHWKAEQALGLRAPKDT